MEKNHLSDEEVSRISKELLRQMVEELKEDGDEKSGLASVFAEKIANVAWSRFQMAVGRSVGKNLVMILLIGAICAIAWWKLNVDPYIHVPHVNVDK